MNRDICRLSSGVVFRACILPLAAVFAKSSTLGASLNDTSNASGASSKEDKAATIPTVEVDVDFSSTKFNDTTVLPETILPGGTIITFPATSKSRLNMSATPVGCSLMCVVVLAVATGRLRAWSAQTALEPKASATIHPIGT